MILAQNTLSDDVAKIIRKMILNGELHPGERINQVQLAKKFNISRGPIREALKLLQNEGLIKYEVNKGTYVATLSKQDTYEIYTLRALIEGEAAKLAVENLTEKDFAKLENLLERFKQMKASKDIESQVQCDIDFHGTIVQASRHNRLITIHKNLDTQVGAMYLTELDRSPAKEAKVVENHRILLEALKTKEKEKIKKVFTEHYTKGLKDLY